MRHVKFLLTIFILIQLIACNTISKNPDNSTQLTVGVVQKEIKVGMSGSEVAIILGSPNIVSLDEKEREVWIYDKISSEIIQSTTGSAFNVLILGMSSSSGSRSSNQKTLTIVIKFTKDKKVRKFSYHTSRF